MGGSRRFGSRAGSSMVEFALGSGILVMAFTGTFQYGFIFYQYNALFNAVDNAAHYAALYPYDASCETPSDAFNTAVKNMAVYGNTAGTGNPVLTGLTTGNVTITVTRLSGTGNTCGTVSSTFYPALLKVSISNYTINAVFGSFTANGKPSVTYPFLGLYSPPTS